MLGGAGLGFWLTGKPRRAWHRCMGLVKIKGNIHVYILIEGIYRSVYILQCIECWTHSVQMGIETDRQSLRKDIQYSLKTLI